MVMFYDVKLAKKKKSECKSKCVRGQSRVRVLAGRALSAPTTIRVLIPHKLISEDHHCLLQPHTPDSLS